MGPFGRGIFIRGEGAGECIVDGRGMTMKSADYKPEKKFRVDSLQDGILETRYFLSYDQAEKQFMLEVQYGQPASLAEYLITPHSRWRVIQEEPSEVWKEYRKKNVLH
jgi:hypothetical protein